MSFTYELETLVGLVRFEIGDTAAPGEFSDEEITAKLVSQANVVLLAAADLLDVLAIRAAKLLDFEWQGQSFKQRDAAKYFTAAAKSARDRHAATTDSSIGTIDLEHEDRFPDVEIEHHGRSAARWCL